MSDEAARDASSSPQYSHMQDVSRAWDSLMEAKNVLQRIENKVDLQNRRRSRAQKIRRRLEMDRGLYSGPDTLSEEISNPEQEEEFHSIADQTFTLYGRSSLTHSHDQAEPYLVGFNLGGKSVQKSHVSTCPKNASEMKIYENFSGSRTITDEHVEDVLEATKVHPDVPDPEDAVQVVNPYLTISSPLSAPHVQDEIAHCSACTPQPSPKSDLYTQKLESLKSRSPGSKLERLKERIREQKRRQEAARKNLTKPRQEAELARKVMSAQRIRKVTFGPPPPVHKGFSKSNKEATPVYADEFAGSREKGNIKKTDHKTQRTDPLKALRCDKGKAKCPVSQKLSFKATSPERKEKTTGEDLYGASAWREGQKLVQKILGPSPITLRKRRSHENQEDIQQDNCRRRCRKMRCQDSLTEEHLQHRRDSSQSTDMLQVLRDIQAGKEGLMTSCGSLGDGFERVTNESVFRNISPKRPRSRTVSPDSKENIQDGQPKDAKARSYSVQEVRSYMKRKILERQKAERENQKKMQKAQQTKREQIDNILRKQKEAFPPKRVSASMAANKNSINTGACVTAEVDDIRGDLTEWLHATSSDLLKEEHGGSGKVVKQRIEEHLNNGCTSPLRLRDLTSSPTTHHQDLTDEVHSNDGLHPDNCPKEQSPYRDSQERVQAIWAAAKDLGRRVELEMNRFGAIQLNNHVTPASSHSSPPRERPMTSKMTDQAKTNKLHRTESSKRIKDCVPPLKSSNMVSAQISKCTKGTEKMNNDQGYMVEKMIQPTKSHPKLNTRRAQKSCLTYLPANKSVQKRSESHSPKITQRKTFLSDGAKTTSVTYNGDVLVTPKVKKEISNSELSPRQDSTDKDKKGKSTMLHYGELQPQFNDLRQTRMDITNRIKAHLEQQEKDLAALRLKAEMEAREAERCMQEMLKRDNLQDLPVKLRPKKTHPRDDEQHTFYNPWMMGKPGGAAQRFESALEGFLESACPSTPSAPMKQNTGKPPDKVNILPNENDISERSWDCTDTYTDTATGTTSKWSEMGQFYGSANMFSRFTMEMAQQYLREEELRARHQTALLRLREEALKEKTKAELALLKHQRMYWEMKKEHDKVEEIFRQEEEIHKKLKQEQAEIQHLHNIYKAAHQERKLLLKQQKEILQIQQSAADIQQKLKCSSVQVSEQSDCKASSNPAVDSILCNSILSTEHPHQDTESAISDLSVDNAVMEDTQVEGTKSRAQDSKSNPTMDGADIPHTVREPPKDNQISHMQEHQMIDRLPSEQDRGDESNPLSAKSGPVTGSLQSPLTNLCQGFLMSREDLSNHSQEKKNAANEDDPALSVGVQETHIVPEKDKGVNLDFQSHEMMSKSENADTLTQQQNLNVTTTDRKSKEDAKLVSESMSNNILKPSESNVPLQGQETGNLLPSLSEFHKVSAKLINISESSVSVSDRGKDSQDTESGDSDVFDMESNEGMFNVNEESVARPFDQNVFGQSDENNIIRSVFPSGKQYSCDDKSVEEPSHPSSSPKKSPNSRIAVDLVMEETKTKKAPLASESFPTSEDVTESDSKTYVVEHLLKNQDGTTVKVTDLQISTSMSPENISNVAGMSLSDTKDWTRMTEMNVKQSFTENVIFGKIETAPFHATTFEDLYQIKSFPHPSEGEVIFITDEVLQPIEDTLSEIFSPVDEKLSYGSEDLFSAKQDQSEDLPSFPGDMDSIKSDDVDTEDFPTPPEEIAFFGAESLSSSPDASLVEETHLLYDNLLTERENALVPASKMVYRLPNDGSLEATPVDQRDPRNLQWHRRTPFLTLSKAEDDLHDPLCTFDIGDRVLVKLSKLGTLKYKGSMALRDGYWAGVVLDKAEGDNDGAYEGIRYFECPSQHGVFVRPGQISHLLLDEQTDSATPGGDDNTSGEGPSPRNFSPQDQTGSDRMSGGKGADGKKEHISEKNINQTRSCCLRPSGESSDKKVTDACDIYSNGVKTKVVNEVKDPGQDSSCLLQGKQQTLVLKVTDKIFNSLLSDVFETLAKISQCKFNKDRIGQYRINTEESIETYSVAPNKNHGKLLATKRKETGEVVESIAHKIVTETIKDCIEKYNQIKKKEKKNSWPTDNSFISVQGSEIPKDVGSVLFKKDKMTAITTVANRTIEEILTDSLKIMDNIGRHKADTSVSGTELVCFRRLHPESSENQFCQRVADY